MYTLKYHSALDAYLKRTKKWSNSMEFTYGLQFTKVAKIQFCIDYVETVFHFISMFLGVMKIMLNMLEV